MTLDEAVVFLSRYLDSEYYTDKCNEAHQIAIEALKKQIPKKPIENDIGGYICPHCQGVILDLPHELYHRDCGGRLE